MKLTVFHAADGDCLLLSSGDRPPRRVLVDGGRRASYAGNARAFLGALRDRGGKIDVVCVSHIDDDHITGVLQLVEDEVEWRAFEFRRSLDRRAPSPDVPRPPEIGEVWHNGLFRLVGSETAPAVEGLLESVATVLAGSPDERLQSVASALDDLATGERSSMELSRRLAPEQLGIPLNPPARGGLMKRGRSRPRAGSGALALGGLKVLVLGPSDDDIQRLRVSWQTWIDENRAALARLQAEMLRDERNLGTLAPRVVANPLIDAALGEGLRRVTEANLASLMLLVEEGPKSVLLTGDGVSSEILAGLGHHRKLDAEGRIHVDVLKVQHHGALANVEEEFVRRVTADHYVFCGNGAHTNPEIEVVEAFARARLRGLDGGGPIGPATPFAFWFTSSARTPDPTRQKKNQAHMKRVESAVRRLRRGHASRLKATFLTEGHFEIDLS